MALCKSSVLFVHVSCRFTGNDVLTGWIGLCLRRRKMALRDLLLLLRLLRGGTGRRLRLLRRLLRREGMGRVLRRVLLLRWLWWLGGDRLTLSELS
jgi:hypothetical protein